MFLDAQQNVACAALYPALFRTILRPIVGGPHRVPAQVIATTMNRPAPGYRNPAPGAASRTACAFIILPPAQPTLYICAPSHEVIVCSNLLEKFVLPVSLLMPRRPYFTSKLARMHGNPRICNVQRSFVECSLHPHTLTNRIVLEQNWARESFSLQCAAQCAILSIVRAMQ